MHRLNHLATAGRNRASWCGELTSDRITSMLWSMSSTSPSPVRPDLLAAQAAAWRHVTSPGASWTGAERRAIAQTAIAALDDTDPLPPWVSPTSVGRSMPIDVAAPRRGGRCGVPDRPACLDADRSVVPGATRTRHRCVRIRRDGRGRGRSGCGRRILPVRQGSSGHLSPRRWAVRPTAVTRRSSRPR